MSLYYSYLPNILTIISWPPTLEKRKKRERFSKVEKSCNINHISQTRKNGYFCAWSWSHAAISLWRNQSSRTQLGIVEIQKHGDFYIIVSLRVKDQLISHCICSLQNRFGDREAHLPGLGSESLLCWPQMKNLSVLIIPFSSGELSWLTISIFFFCKQSS